MKKGNNKPLRFDTRKNVRSMRVKRFAAAFSCFFVLLGGISFLLLLRYYNFDLSAIGSPAEETTVEETTLKPEPQVSGSYRCLLLCTADSSNEVRFAAILHADMEALELSVTPLDSSKVLNYGGCNGNLKAISKLLDGATVEEIESKLLGNTCGRRSTSCTDQLAIAVKKAYNEISGEA